MLLKIHIKIITTHIIAIGGGCEVDAIVSFRVQKTHARAQRTAHAHTHGARAHARRVGLVVCVGFVYFSGLL